MKDKKVAALMFNVKGADLLFLDKPSEARKGRPRARRLREARTEGTAARGSGEMYESLGIEVKPFETRDLRAPARYGMESEKDRLRRGHTGAQAEHSEERAGDSCVYPVIWELGDVLPYAGYVFELRTWTTSSAVSKSSVTGASGRRRTSTPAR